MTQTPNGKLKGSIEDHIEALYWMNLNIAWRFADILVAKGILTKDQAKATMFALAEMLRNDRDARDEPNGAVDLYAQALEEQAKSWEPKGE